MIDEKRFILLWSTGNEMVDTVLEEVVATFESEFPNRVRGYYIFGSYRNGTALSNSDLDIAIVFKGVFEDASEGVRVRSQIEECVSASSIELDLTVNEEDRLFQMGNATLKLDSTCIYGEDIRDKLQFPDIDDWIRDRMQDGFGYIKRLRDYASKGSDKDLSFPLDYPDPEGEFFGYDAKSIKEFAITIGWCASAILALKLRTHVFRKKDCLDLYRSRISDEWTGLVEGVFEKIRREWNYTIPTNEEERMHLRELCTQALGFENHFFAIYEKLMVQTARVESSILSTKAG